MNLKKHWKCLVVSVFTGIVIGTTATSVILMTKHEKEVTACHAKGMENERKLANICGGYDIGNIRLTEIECNEKLEVCFCGDPNQFKAGGL